MKNVLDHGPGGLFHTQASLGPGDRFRFQKRRVCPHLSQLEHRKMRTVMRKNRATAARLPHRTICICMCPLLSVLPAGPMAGAGVASGRLEAALHRCSHGSRGLVLLQREPHVCCRFAGEAEHS